MCGTTISAWLMLQQKLQGGGTEVETEIETDVQLINTSFQIAQEWILKTSRFEGTVLVTG
jgi:hypothetical protein